MTGICWGEREGMNLQNTQLCKVFMFLASVVGYCNEHCLLSKMYIVCCEFLVAKWIVIYCNFI